MKNIDITKAILLLSFPIIMSCKTTEYTQWPILHEVKTEEGTRIFFERNDLGYYTLWTKLSSEADSLAVRIETPYCRYEEGDDFYEDGVPDPFFYKISPDNNNLYVTACIHANSNGWTTEYQLFKIDCMQLKTELLAECAAIAVTDTGFTIARCRCTNEGTATCTAEENWVMHDEHLNWDGRITNIDSREYDADEMQERYLNPDYEYKYLIGFNSHKE